MTFTRRGLLLGAASTAIAGKSVHADNPAIILREEIHGVHPRYASYASVGPFTYANSPLTLKAEGFDVVIFSPQRIDEARLIVFSHGALARQLFGKP